MAQRYKSLLTDIKPGYSAETQLAQAMYQKRDNKNLPSNAKKVTVAPKPEKKIPIMPTTQGGAITLDIDNMSSADRKQVQRNIINMYENKPFRTGFLNALDLTAGELARSEKSLEIFGGDKKDLDEAKSKTAYKAGTVGGVMAQFAIPYAGASGAVGKAVTSIPKVAKMGKLGQGITRSVATDLAVGLPLNVNYAYNKEGLRGTDALKNIGINTGIDLVAGGILEVIGGVILKNGKRVKSKAEFDGLSPNEKQELLGHVEQLALSGPTTDQKLLTGINWQAPNRVDFYANTGGATSPNASQVQIAGQLPAPARVYNPTRRTLAQQPEIVLPDYYVNQGGTVGRNLENINTPMLQSPTRINQPINATRRTLGDPYADFDKAYDEAVKIVTDYIKNYKGKGVQVGVIPKNGDDLMRDGGTRFAQSNNDIWYQDFWKANKRKPNKSEAEEIARYEITTALRSGSGEFFDDNLYRLYREAVNKDTTFPRVDKAVPQINQQPYVYNPNREAINTLSPSEISSSFQGNINRLSTPVINTQTVPQQNVFSGIPQRIEPKPQPRTNREVPRTITKGEAVGEIPKVSKVTQSANMPAEPPRMTAQARNTESGVNIPTTPKVVKESTAQTAKQGSTPKSVERGFSRNVKTDKNMEQPIRKSFLESPETYEKLANKDTLARANKILADSGTRESYDTVLNAIANNDLRPEHIPLARKVANQLAKDGDIDGARKIISEISVKLTESGQLSQAANILRNSDPMAVLQFIQKTIDKTNISLAKRIKGFEGLKLTDNEIQRLANIDIGDETAINQAIADIGTRLAKGIPSTMFEKFDELRRIAMLGNFKTQARNVVGNVPLALERKLSNKVSAVIQKARLPKEERTQALFITKESKELAKQLYNADKEWLLSSNKWDTSDIRKILNSEREVFKQSIVGKAANKAGASGKIQQAADLVGLEGARKLTYGALQLGDAPFLKSAYVDRMASYISAQGYKTIKEIPQAALDMAREEALKATFRDANSAARFINDLKRKGGFVGKVTEATIPFVTTPTNLVRRTIDYSPIGFIKGIAKMKKADDIPKVIDEMAQGLTGTALVGLGVWLAQNGILIGGSDKNKKKANYEKTTGKLPFSIQTPQGSITYDWAQPFGSQLAIASELYKAYNEAIQEKGEFTALDMANAIAESTFAGVDVILESSVYQNVLDLFNGYGSVGERMVNNLMDYPTQVIPTALGQTARASDEYVRNAYDKTDKIASYKNRIQTKFPTKSKELPIKYDVWGRPEKRVEGTGARMVQEFLNPANVKAKNETLLDKEILALHNRTGTNDVLPRTAPYYFDAQGTKHELNNKEVSEFQKNMGQYSYRNVQKLITSAKYQGMDDTDKVKALNNIYADAAEHAKREYLKSKNLPQTLALSKATHEKYMSVRNKGITDEKFIKIMQSVDRNNNGSVSQDEARETLDSTTLTNEQKMVMWAAINKGWKNNPY